jgi:hypothetical protein
VQKNIALVSKTERRTMFGLLVKDRASAARGDIAVPPPPKQFKVSVREEREANTLNRFQAKMDRRANIMKASRNNDLVNPATKKTNDAYKARVKSMKLSAEKKRKAADKAAASAAKDTK